MRLIGSWNKWWDAGIVFGNSVFSVMRKEGMDSKVPHVMMWRFKGAMKKDNNSKVWKIEKHRI